MRFTVDPWDPSYGIANEIDGLDEATAEVVVDLEVPAEEWRPIAPSPSIGHSEQILFVDGVRRVEARVWLHDGDAAHAAMCASYAAGVVVCNGAARVTDVRVGRGLFTTHGAASSIATRAGEFTVRQASSATPEGLALALQERMNECEIAAVNAACQEVDADLVIVDGPLRGRQHLSNSVGYVKTHHVAYLPSELGAVVTRLQPGERTPVFCVGTSWTRLSWYLRLPRGNDAPWSGVVRCECAADTPTVEAAALADSVAVALPRFASHPHKDPRAPQNLYPIAGLERDLRHRLGDPEFLYRSIRIASAAAA